MLTFVVPKGSKITFTTETFGLGFFVGQRKVCFVSFFSVVLECLLIFQFRRELRRSMMGGGVRLVVRNK